MKARIVVSREQAGQTVAALVRQGLGGVAWSRARRLVENGQVTVDGEVVTDEAARLSAGQELSVDEARPARATGPRVSIVYEDPHVVVIDKPSGISSVPYEKRESGTAMDLLREAWRASGRSRPTAIPLFVVHRIDKDTSGLLMFAKTRPAERALQAMFRAHALERSYLCVAHGRVTDRRIESRLVEDRGDGLRGSTRRPGQGKRAVTHVKALEQLPEATLCEVRLETGKTHQIRIHLAEGGHPIVGERVYLRDFLARGHEPLPSARLLLHAATLGFTHPVSGEVVRLSSPLPPDFEAALDRLRATPKKPRSP